MTPDSRITPIWDDALKALALGFMPAIVLGRDRDGDLCMLMSARQVALPPDQYLNVAWDKAALLACQLTFAESGASLP